MGYTRLENQLREIKYDKGSLEFAALTFIRENCEKLRFDKKKNKNNGGHHGGRNNDHRNNNRRNHEKGNSSRAD